jgi:nitrate/TMAO reductase-like tetraheme cytochrome c subunit
MRFFLLFFLSISALFGAQVVEVGDRFQNSQSCKACHLRIVNEWENSLHAKSHYENDEYFQKSIDYVSKKTRKSLNGVKVECATCHNPRISVTSTGEDYEIAAVMGLDKGSAVNKAVNNDAISEGINCVVCHNIDKIHDEYDDTKRGINRVEWTESGTMTGPYKDSKSPYHKTVHHDFMDQNPNQLCFVCHANDRSKSGLVFTDMQSEYKNSTKTCVDCHMGPKKLDVASTYKMNGERKVREVRNHGFAGAHTSSMWKDALSLSLEHNKKDILVTIKNPQPHNIPSGFGSRELIVELSYKKGMKVIKENSISLTRHYTRKKNIPTIPHLATAQSKDMSIPAEGKKVLKVAKVNGATSIEVKLYYRLVNDEVRTLLDLKGKNWEQKHYITEATLKF